MRHLLLVGLVIAACRHPAEPVMVDAAGGDRLRVATFNVRRFFDTVCASGSCADGDYEALPSAAAFEARADEIAAAIRLLEADVVALQEIETQAGLDALLARLAPEMPHGVLGEIHTPASVDVAVVSRTPLDQVIGHRTSEPLTRPDGTVTTFSRELLEVHTRVDSGARVVLFAAHFKSKAGDDPGRRLAEAQVTSRIMTEVAAETPDALVVLGGDLNDTPGSPPLDALTAEGGLVRVADDLPEAAQATYLYLGRAQAIDHILLAPTPVAARVPRSSSVWWDGSGWGGSDHAALTSDFRVTSPR